MPIDPPYRTDPWQNILRINWSGAAVQWWTAFPDGGGRFIATPTGAEVATDGTVAVRGETCLISDMTSTYPGFGGLASGVRIPPHNWCDWPIPDKLETPNDWQSSIYGYSFNSYSAGTLYRTVSEVALAAANSRRSGDTTWNCRFFAGTSPPNLIGGPDTSPAEGALCPELNGAGTDWENYYSTYITLVRPLWHPNYRIFVVKDEDFNTGMAGIHDPVDRPDIGTNP